MSSAGWWRFSRPTSKAIAASWARMRSLDALTARREILDGLRTQRWIILGGNVTFHNLTGSRQVTNLACRD